MDFAVRTNGSGNKYKAIFLDFVDDEGVKHDQFPFIITDGYKNLSDKNMIRALLKLPQYKRGEFSFVEPMEEISAYLDNENLEDTLTKEMLNGLTAEGVHALGELYGCKHTQLNLIINEIEGKFVTTKAREIVDEFQKTVKPPKPPKVAKVQDEK